MKDVQLYYDGYYGSIDQDEQGYNGKILHTSDLVLYEGDSVDALVRSFKSAVEAYKELRGSFTAVDSYERRAV